MRLLRLLAVSLCVSGLFLLPSFAQTSQASPEQQAPPLSGDFLNKAYLQQWAAEQKEFRIQRSRREMPGQQAPKPFAGDPGIVANRPGATSNECLTIVSYNFSAGANPHLESVTTCTSVDKVLTRRTHRDKGKKSPELPLVQTNLVLTSH